MDRRTGDERRYAVSLDYFTETPVERRKGNERRKKGEMRDDWVRVTQWSSVPKELHAKEHDPHGDQSSLR